MREIVLPAIERWWPHLEIEFKHEILVDLEAPLSSQTLAEVARLCGATIETGPATLSEREREYIRTQIEFVD